MSTSYDPERMAQVPIEEDSDDEEAQYDVLDIRHRQRTTRLQRFRIVFLLLVVTLVSLAIGLGVHSSNENSQSSSSSAASISLPMPPADVASKCSTQSVATTDGALACKTACEVSDCCDYPANLALSCLAGNEDICLAYHQSCNILNPTSTFASPIPPSVPPAPGNLKDMCNPNNILSVDGFTDCQEACNRAPCCYDTHVATCTHDECWDYSPCLNLAAASHVDADIPNLINQACASEQLTNLKGRVQCRQVCSHALCCFQSIADNRNTAETNMCLQEDTSFCRQYEKCAELETIKPVDATPEEIQLVCQDDEDIPGHTSLCELVCQKGACCFSDVGCAELAPDLQCDDYQPCRKVMVTELRHNDDDDDGGNNATDTSAGGETENTNPPVDNDGIFDACQSEDQVALCTELCLPGACCFTHDACEVPDIELHCTNFAACGKLYPATDDDDGASSQNPVVDKDAVDQACLYAETITVPGQPSLCLTLCIEGECCFDSAGCSVPDPESYCTNYGACGKLHGSMADVLTNVNDDNTTDTGTDDNGNTTDTGTDDNGNTTDTGTDDQTGDGSVMEIANPYINTEAIYDACESQGQDALCAHLCQPGACCFSLEVCEVPDVELHCTNFAACGKLFPEDNSGGDTTDQNPVIDMDELNDACAIAETVNVPNQPSLCQTLCEKGECCFDPSGCSVPDPERYCTNFAACGMLHTATDDDDSVNGGDNTTDTGDGGDNTTDTGAGDAPSEAEAGMEIANPYVNIEGIYDACESENQVALCTQLCLPGACCFTRDACEVPDVELHCTNFAACGKLYPATDDDDGDDTADQNPVVDKDAIDDVCLDAEIITVPGELSLCQTLCEAGACCFDADGCSVPDPESFCINYGACGKLYAALEDVVDNGDDVTTDGDDGINPDDFTAEDIQAACLNDEDPTEIGSMCMKLCESAVCCFKGDTCSENKDCTKYAACSVAASELDRRRLSGMENDGTIEIVLERETPDDPDTTEELEAVCGGADMNRCDEICQEAACCYADSEEASCMQTNPSLNCNVYKQCDVIYGYQVDNRSLRKSLKKQIKAACIDDEGGLEACENLCSSGSCCFKHKDCTLGDDVDCLVYAPCFIVFGETDDDEFDDIEEDDALDDVTIGDQSIQPSAAIIQAACSDIDMVEIPGQPLSCEELCAEGACCFDSREGCQNTVMDCSIYSACGTLFAVDEQDDDSTEIDEVGLVLQMEVASACDGTDPSHCVQKCVQATCCYALSEEETCQYVNPGLNCDIYRACNTVFGRKEDIDEEDNTRGR